MNPPIRHRALLRFPRPLKAPMALLLSLILPLHGMAGDILRGGAAAGGGRRNEPQPGADVTAGSAAAQAARRNAGDALARTSRAIEAVQRLQLQARSQVGGGNGINPNSPGTQLPSVPDGLGTGGLDVLVPPVGADAPTQTPGTGSSVTVTVKQQLQQAFLQWRTFNVGRNTTLYFDQTKGGKSAGQWIAFNSVKDPTGRPSQILGQIKAEGQVYVINANGIIFGRNSQVNAHALVASALPVNTNLTSSGLLNNPDLQPLFSAIEVAAGAKGTPKFTPDLNGTSKVGDVRVEAGAQITAPTTEEKVGGRVVLAGANVVNEGTISTPDGQAILAAGLQVGMMGHSSSDPSLRGLDVFVGAVEDPLVSAWTGSAGTVTNLGIINAQRGNITMAGKSVRQSGVLAASTSVSFNGRIDLQAAYGAVANPIYDPTNTAFGAPFLFGGTGDVVLGQGSVTQILPEWESNETLVGTRLALPSQVNLRGRVVRLMDDAMLLAPNATVNLDAGAWKLDSIGGTLRNQFVYSEGQVHVGKGAFINVAGSAAVQASILQNILTLQLRGSEFADFSYNRNGDLRGVDLMIDVRRQGVFDGRTWVGTPLADASGFVGLIQRDAAQLTIDGGNLNIRSGGSVILQQGSTLDVSGGYVDYQGAVVTTSRVMLGGRLVDIADATPDTVYDGLYTGSFTTTSNQWGVSRTYTSQLLRGTRFEAGYVYGGAGGSLNIQAPSLALDATMNAGTVNGQRQLEVQAAHSTLSIQLQNQKAVGPTYFNQSPTPPTVLFQSGLTQTGAPDFAVDGSGNAVGLSGDRLTTLLLSPENLKRAGFGKLTVGNHDGSVVLAAGEALEMQPGGGVTLEGANIDIQGSIVSHGGSVALSAYNLSPFAVDELRQSADPSTPLANIGRGRVTVAGSSVIDVSGSLVDDRFSLGTSPYMLAGGSLNISAYDVDIRAGSQLDVSGGARVDGVLDRTYGRGGNLTLKGGADLNLNWVGGGSLKLAGQLRGMAGTGVLGGSLTLQAPLIQVGGTASSDTLLVSSEFFNQGGFSSHRLIGVGIQSGPETYRPGLVIDASARVKPEVQSYIYKPDGPAMNVRKLLPHPGLRQPSSLSFSATGAVDEFSRLMTVRGDLVAQAGSVIDAGARGSVAFTADTVSLLGSVSASGGRITVQGADRLPTLDPNPPKAFTTVYLGSTARLSTAGSFLAVPDAFGRRIGTLLSGGKIQVSGNIVAEEGSRLDASGTAETVDVIPANLGGNSVGGSLAGGDGSVPPSSGLTAPVNGIASKSVRLESDGGTIILDGGQMLHTQADLRARAGGSTAEGGTLEVSSGRFYENGVTPEPDDINLSVGQSRPGGAFFADPLAAIGAAPSVPSGIGYFAADEFASGGFDNLKLGGNVAFDGSVAIQARGSLAVATGGVLQASADVLVAGRHVALGKVFDAPLAPTEVPNPFLQDVQPFFFAPTSGGGSLTVQAQLIDIGNLSLQGIGSASFIAQNGDIRGNGTFNMAGSLIMQAAQVYPVTGTDFTVSVYDPSALVKGSAAFETAGSKALPLSAGGSLKVYASNIRQDGVLRAPYGSIELGWNGEGTRPQDLIAGSKAQIPVTQSLSLGSGSITSVSGVDPLTGKGLLVPYGTSTDGVSWIDPSGLDITAGGLPEKTILLSSRQIITQTGAQQDLRGGGDLLAYRFVSGTSGTRDILADEGLFAVLPGYQDWYAPFGAFNTGAEAASLKGDLGYVNGTIRVGDRVQLGGGAGLAAGLYTLLPARYALLPGAFLITPQSGVPVSSQLRPDGAVLTSGQRYNTSSATRTAPLLQQRFEIASSATLAQRAQYDTFSANTFLAAYAAQRGFNLQRLPRDSGRMVLDATSAMSLAGTVTARPISAQGRDGRIDISSPLDIIIGHQDSAPVAGKLLLDARQLSSFGVGSLLIGGVRSQAEDGTAVAVKTRNITVDNMNMAEVEAEVLEGPEIILAASGLIELKSGAVVRQAGVLSGDADTLLLGSNSLSGSGSGSLLRVSSDLGAAVRRFGVTPGTGAAAMTLGAGSQVSGVSVLLDSTFATTFASSAVVEGTSIGFSSGQISLVLGGSSGPTSGRGLVLDASALSNLGSARSLSLLSYTTLDTYGSGTLGGGLDSLSLSAAQIRGFSNSGGVVTFAARRVDIANSANAAASGTETGTAGGTLRIEAEELHLGGNASRIVQYGVVQAEASKGIFLDGTGSLTVGGSLSLAAPWMKSAAGSSQSINSTGSMEVTSAGSAVFQAGGAAASLSLTGSSLLFDSRMTLPSGSVTLRATTGSLQVGGVVSTAGIASGPAGQQRLLQGGSIRLAADQGGVTVSGTLDVSAVAGGEAGRLDISVPSGSVSLGSATLLGTGGASFGLDVRQMASTSSLHSLLNNAGFTGQRDLRVRDGDVVLDGSASVTGLTVSADAGAVRVTGQVDASGVTGGTIRLLASKGVTLQSGSRLDVSAEKVDSAGKGGAVYLETRGQSGGQIDIQSGSVIDLSVDAALTAGEFSGTLHLRAPQTGGSTDLGLRPVTGSILGASAITAEGFQVYDLTGSGTITSAVRDQVLANGSAFAVNESTITSRLFTGANAGLASSFVLLTGAELINRTGDLTLGNTNPGAGSTAWDLSGFRFGARQSAGVLTLRAAGNLVFNESLSDGFTSGAYNAQLMTNNSLVSDPVEGWSYRLAAGADFSSVDHRSVVQGTGSLLLGRNAGDANEIASNLGEKARTSVAVAGFYQVIRTGGGGIDISTGADVRLLNQYASIYSAGVRVVDPTMGGRFDLPILDFAGGTSSLGPVQQTPPYAVQYAQGGGNVEIRAGNDILHLTRNAAGELVADSQRQLPMNWLYRRGYVDPMTGQFGAARFGDVATTTWWVDYSNFFEGVGALGGGNISMSAGRDIANVDAVVPTNARLSKDGVLTELGGGSLSVRAGRNLDAGVYYVERGAGNLRAGGSIITNATRSPSLTNLADAAPLASQTWLPTQLFVGKSSFDVRAGRDVLIAPASNPFLLPGGYSNSFWYKTYFNTYSQDASVSVTSLSGSVTLRSSTTLPTVGGGGAMSVLLAWIQNQLLYNAQNPGTSSFYHPWLRLNETKVDSFGTVASLAPGSLKLAALGGNVNVVGGVTLAPSSRGTLDILATGSVNALQPNGRTTVNGAFTTAWGSSIINVSDASPQSIPGLANPFAFQTLGGLAASTASASGDNFLLFLDASLRETGSTQGAFGVLQAKQALHAQGLLHAGDTEPVRVTAQGGDISGLGLFTPKMARILAARDIRDVAFYLQNTAASDVSVVSSGRDMILNDAGSLLRTLANSSGNIINVGDSPLAGDIQVSGPGSLQVLAGRHLDLGSGGNNSDGTGVGVTSIGNGRNPSLPFDGASLTLAAGIGPSAGLVSSSVDFSRFITDVINGPRGAQYLSDYGKATGSTVDTLGEFQALSPDEQRRVALGVFAISLRTAGREHSSKGTDYEDGFAAIASLFPGTSWSGDITTQARDIRTKSGGSIDILVPGGGLKLATALLGNSLAPPGIITEGGGGINIFANQNVDIGIARIFTLRGGDEVIWSSKGDIAAGSSSKTVQSAPPTRVIIDPQSADLKTDLAGLATGGGIGVLATVANVPPGNVDLIAPNGTVDAGDAGIRATGNLNIAATVVLNSGNISVGGTASGGAAAPAAAAVNVSGMSSSSNTAAAAANTAATKPGAAKENTVAQNDDSQTPSMMSVEVLGYGGGEADEDEEQKKRRQSLP